MASPEIKMDPILHSERKPETSQMEGEEESEQKSEEPSQIEATVEAVTESNTKPETSSKDLRRHSMITSDGRFFTLNTGARIPAVGLGTWQIDGGSCKSAVAAALEVGYRHFDCAHLYGNENDVGEILIGAMESGLKREEVFVTSKFWCTTNSATHVDQAVETSLKNLGVAHLDLFLVHWPVVPSVVDATDPPRHRPQSKEMIHPSRRFEVTWRAMENLVEKGLVRAIGLSNFSVSQIEDVLRFARVVPAVHQMELHPLWRQDDVVGFCQSHGIHVSAHTPLGIPGRPDGSREQGGDEEIGSESAQTSPSLHAPMLRISVVAEIASKLGRTPAQVLLRWGVQRGTSVLPRSLLMERIKTNLDILDWSLSEDDWNRINSIEPQLSLIGETHSLSGSLSSSMPLPSVVETLDDIVDESGYESNDDIDEDCEEAEEVEAEEHVEMDVEAVEFVAEEVEIIEPLDAAAFGS